MKNDEAPQRTFTIPRDLFRATFDAMQRAKGLNDGEEHKVAELRPQSEILAEDALHKKKKGLLAKIVGFQAGARKIADNMDSARKQQ